MADAVGGQERDEAFLPVVVTAFDFALGLGSGRVAQGDAVEVQGGSELGEGVGCVGEKEGVIMRDAIAFSILRGAQMAQPLVRQST